MEIRTINEKKVYEDFLPHGYLKLKYSGFPFHIYYDNGSIPYMNKISSKMVARHVALSDFYFRKIFKEVSCHNNIAKKIRLEGEIIAGRIK